MPGQSHEEAERFFQQQQGGNGPAGFANMDGLRRELESVARGASPHEHALKGDRGMLAGTRSTGLR